MLIGAHKKGQGQVSLPRELIRVCFFQVAVFNLRDSSLFGSFHFSMFIELNIYSFLSSTFMELNISYMHGFDWTK